MRSILRFSITVLVICLGTAVCAQSDPLERAFSILKGIDERFSKNPNDSLTAEKRHDLDFAIGVFEERGRRYEWATALFYRANTAENLRQPRQMFADLEKSRQILETMPGDSATLMLGHVWNAYSAYYNTFLFDFHRSSQALDNSIACYRKIKHQTGVAESMGNFAFTLSLYGQGSMAIAQARKCEQEFKRLYEAEKNRADITQSFIHFLFGNAYFMLSDSLLHAGEPLAAKQYVELSVAQLEKIQPGDRVDLSRLANTWFLKSLAYVRLNTRPALDSARANIDRAINIFAFAGATPQSPFGLAQALKGGVLIRQDSLVQGESLIVAGLKNLGLSVTGFYARVNPPAKPTVVQIQGLLVKITTMDLLNREKPDARLQTQMVDDTETIAMMIDAIKDDYDNRQSFERLSDLMSVIYAIGVDAAASLARTGVPGDWKARGFRLSELGKGFALRFNIVKRLMPGEAAAARTNPKAEGDAFSLADVRRLLLDSTTAAIEYSIGLAKTTALVITQNGMEMVTLPPLDQWKKDLESADSLLRASKSFNAQSARLYQALVEPLVKNLPPGIKHLILVPDGPLWKMPFDALVTGKNKDGTEQFLIESYALSQSYSLQIAALMAENLPQTSGQSLGVYVGAFERSGSEEKDNFSKAFTPFPRLIAAAERIAAGWPADRPVSGLTEFLSRLAGHDLALIGTHGFADKNLSPDDYFLAFGPDSSAWLYVRDIYELETGKAQLIFLAACLTAYGGSYIRGEGLPSLARAFHYAGIPTLITAATAVPEGATADIAEFYFQEIKSNGPISAAEALRRAKLNYVKKYKVKPHPKFWAPLTCLGYGNLKLP